MDASRAATGISDHIVALLLAALGIPQETIIADYTESQTNLQPLLPELMSAAEYPLS